MATWTAKGSVSQGYTLYLIVNQISQNTAENTSKVSWSIKLVSQPAYDFWKYGNTVTVKINGKEVLKRYEQSIIGSDDTLEIGSGTETITHNSDGKKTISCEATWVQTSFNSYTPGNISIKGKTLELTPIPRGSDLGTIAGFTFGNDVSIPITKHHADFVDSLAISVGGTAIKTINPIVNGQKINFTATELTKIYAKLPTTSTGVVTFKLTTKSGTTTIGSSKKTAIGTIPATIKPTISGITVSEANTAVKNLGAGYIASQSQLNLAITGAGAGAGATISSYRITDGTSVINKVSGQTAALAKPGTIPITATVTDSRGRSTSYSIDITVVDYKAPTISSSRVIRGSPSTILRAIFAGSITSLGGKNSAVYTIKTKLKTTSTWTTAASNVAISGTTISIDRSVTGYDTTKSYDVQIIVADKLTSVAITLSLPTDAVILDESKDGVGIMKYRERGALDVGGDAYISGNTTINGTASAGGYVLMPTIPYQSIPSATYPTSADFLKVVLDSIPAVNGVYGLGFAWGGKDYCWGTGLVCAGGNRKYISLHSMRKGLLIASASSGVYTYHANNVES